MFNNIVLDVFIGLIFVFLLYSLLATILMELYARAFNLRARMLQKALRRMLEDDNGNEDDDVRKPIWKQFTILAYFYDVVVSLVRFFNPHWKDERLIKKFYTHPSIKYLGEDNTSSKPSYLHCHNFSQTIIQLLRGNGYDGRNQQESELIKNALDNNLLQIKSETLLQLRNLFADARQDSLIFKLRLEDWFDETMQRANGWYKKQTQVVLIIIGFYLAYLFNVDTVAIYKILATDKEARKNMVQMAINNKDKYQATIAAMDTAFAAKLKTTKDTVVVQYISDSLLRQTYQSMVADAENANKILALGKPWKDSCKICEDSLPAKNKITRAPVIEAFKKLADSKPPLSSRLQRHVNQQLQLLQKDQHFADRCKFIEERLENTTFKYSPNQEGGWTTFFGWVITALAISLGAPFWFDLLNKFIQLRGTGTRPSGDKPVAANAASPDNTTTKTSEGKTIRG